MIKVFISYVRENEEDVIKLSDRLKKSTGIKVWLDRDSISPGSFWKDAIAEGIANGDFFVACFSKEYAEKSISFMNEELYLAIEQLRLRPIDRKWFIPILLSECNIPKIEIGGRRTLQDIQWVRIYNDWETGIQKILKVINPKSILAKNIDQQYEIHCSHPKFINGKQIIAEHNFFGNTKYLIYDFEKNSVNIDPFLLHETCGCLHYSQSGNIVFIGNKIGEDRNYGLFYLSSIDTKNVKSILLTDDQIDAPELSPDSNFILYDKLNCGTKDGIYIVDTKNSIKVAYLKSAYAGAWSPSGEEIVFNLRENESETILIKNIKSNNSIKLTVGYGAKWSPDGKKICYTDRSTYPFKIGIIDIKSGYKKLIDHCKFGSACYPLWFPNNNALLFNLDGNVAIYYINTDKTEIVVPGGIYLIEDIATDSNYISYFHASDQGDTDDAYVFDLKNNKKIRIGSFKLSSFEISKFLQRLDEIETDNVNYNLYHLESFKNQMSKPFL
jgi:hypothetical protein